MLIRAALTALIAGCAIVTSAHADTIPVGQNTCLQNPLIVRAESQQLEAALELNQAVSWQEMIDAEYGSSFSDRQDAARMAYHAQLAYDRAKAYRHNLVAQLCG